MILLAKGWTIVRRKISAGGRVKIAIFITTYAIVLAGLEAWLEYDEHSHPEVIRYRSVP